MSTIAATADLSPGDKRALLARLLAERAAPKMRPVSYAQSRLWFLDQMNPGQGVYNIPISVPLDGFVDVNVLRSSVNEIVRRHEALRTTIRMVDRRPVQVIAPALEIDIPIVALGAGEPAEMQAGRLTIQEGQRPFDLTKGPLIRATLLRLAPTRHVLVVVMHHIVSDGWSVEVFSARARRAVFDVQSQATVAPSGTSDSVRRLCQVAGRSACRCRPGRAARLLALRACRPQAEARLSARSPAAAHCDASRRHLAVRDRAGAARGAERNRTTRGYDAVHGFDGGVPNTAPPLQRRDRFRHRLAHRQSAAAELAALIGFFVNHDRAAGAACTADDVSRAAGGRAPHDARSLRAPRSAVRETDRGDRPGARHLAQPALSGDCSRCTTQAARRRTDRRQRAD